MEEIDLSGIRAAVVTISTSKSRGEGSDESGPLAVSILEGNGAEVVASDLIPDDHGVIVDVLERHSDHLGVNLIVTTGGTGIAPTDITPEATLAATEKVIPGIGELMREVSMGKTPHAVLSRGIAAVRGKTLIINLPGSPGAVRDCLGAVLDVIPHACRLIAEEPTTHVQT